MDCFLMYLWAGISLILSTLAIWPWINDVGVYLDGKKERELQARYFYAMLIWADTWTDIINSLVRNLEVYLKEIL